MNASRSLRVMVVLLLAAATAACNTTPLGVVADVDAERRLGEQSTPAFLAANGGIYDKADIQAYLDALAVRLSENASIPEGFGPLRIAILDTDTPSAYTVPGGGIYVSRGMIAIANDEAELAGVIAHEIGHVIARHVAERVAATERLVLDVVRKESRLLTGSRSRRIAVLTQKVTERLDELSSFSEEQELEADRLSIGIMRQAGYDPGGMGRILQRIDRWQRWRLASIGFAGSRFDEWNAQSGYPATTARVAALDVTGEREVNAEAQARLMAITDGMAAENVYQGGVIRNRRYRNALQGVTFEVPDDFLPLQDVQARLVSEAMGIWFQFFDVGDLSIDEARTLFERRGVLLGGSRQSTVNGLPALMGQPVSPDLPKNGGTQLVLIDGGRSYLAMMLIARKPVMDDAAKVFDRVVASVRPLKSSDPITRRVYRTRRAVQGDTIAEIARTDTMGEDAEMRLRILNGLSPGGEPVPGSWIKLIE